VAGNAYARSADGLKLGVRQRDVEVLRIEAPAQPLEQLLVLFVIRLGQDCE
jgi:hypothetical protein